MLSRIPWTVLAFACVVGASGSCDRDNPATPKDNGQSKSPDPPLPKNILEFPASLRVDDDAINAMIERAMSACALGDYNQFRSLWSVREEPISKEEFEEGWKAVREIRIRALQKIRINKGSDNDNRATEQVADELHYVVLADVVFDPSLKATQKEPEREVVLLIIPEQDSWRVARAPKSIREWIQQQLSTKSATGGP